MLSHSKGALFETLAQPFLAPNPNQKVGFAALLLQITSRFSTQLIGITTTNFSVVRVWFGCGTSDFAKSLVVYWKLIANSTKRRMVGTQEGRRVPMKAQKIQDTINSRSMNFYPHFGLETSKVWLDSVSKSRQALFRKNTKKVHLVGKYHTSLQSNFTSTKKPPNSMIDRSISMYFSNHLWWWSWFFHPTNISLSRSVWSVPKNSPNPKSVQISWLIDPSACSIQTIYDGGLGFFIWPIFLCPGQFEVRKKWLCFCSNWEGLPTLTHCGPIQTWVGSLDQPLDSWWASIVNFCMKLSFGEAMMVWSWCKRGLWQQWGKRGQSAHSSPPPTPPRDLGVQMHGMGP